MSDADGAPLVVNVVSTGHQALDHRIFDKEARSLAAAGATVRIFAMHDRAESRDGVELVPLPRSRTRVSRFVIAPWRALREVRRRPAAIVHFHDAELLQIAPVLKLLGQPVIAYDVHEDFANLMLRRDWIPRPLRRLVQAGLHGFERLLARSVDGIVTATASLKAKFPGHPSIHLYNLPSRAFLAQAGEGAVPPSQRPVDVMHLGVLSRERMEFLAAVLAELIERRPGSRVRIVGVQPDQEEWLRGRLPAEAADVRGKVPYAEVAELLRECKLGINVHPTLYPHLRVAVPVKVLEYMGAGCGVVTSYLPEVDRLLQEQTKADMSVLRDAGPQGYAEALVGWLDDPERLDAASARLRDGVTALYSWESEADKLPRLYRELLAKKGQR